MKPLSCIALAVALAGCAPEPGRTEHGIVQGTGDGVPAAVVHLTYRDRSCSGVLVSPRLVATARHCVADVDAAPFACDDHGGVIGSGGHVLGERDARELRVIVGGESIGVTRVFDDGAALLCDHDVAVVELEREATVAPLAVRVRGGVEIGEPLVVAGFGLDDQGRLPQSPRAADVLVTRSGPARAQAGARAVAPDELETGAGGCDGDSGGPALSPGGAVVAIYSRGGNDRPGCSGPGARNVYTMARALARPLGLALAETGAVVESEEGVTLGAADLLPPSGCSFGARAPAPGAPLLLVLCALLALRSRAACASRLVRARGRCRYGKNSSAPMS